MKRCAVSIVRDLASLPLERQREIIERYTSRAGIEVAEEVRARKAKLWTFDALFYLSYEVVQAAKRTGCRAVVIVAPHAVTNMCHTFYGILYVLFRSGYIDELHIASTGMVVDRGEFEAAAPLLAKLALAPSLRRTSEKSPSLVDYLVALAFQPTGRSELDAIARAIVGAPPSINMGDRYYKLALLDAILDALGERAGIMPGRIREIVGGGRGGGTDSDN